MKGKRMPSLSLSINHAGTFVPVTDEAEKHEEAQKETKPAPQSEPVDPLAFGCGFMPGEGI
jgi:hypothetical protein